MVRVIAGPQREFREGPVGREGGEVMRPWERTVGMRVRRIAVAAAVKYMLGCTGNVCV
jgi:hypothetical protein